MEEILIVKVGVGLVAVLGAVVVLAGLAWIALQRPDIPFETLEARYARPTSHFADLPDGVRMHYRDDGEPTAPVVMLIHGYGDSFLTWEPWIERLSPHFRVITVDLAGHGLTRTPSAYDPNMDRYAEQVDALATRLDLSSFAVVGNSMGGGVAWQLASRYPKRVSALVLVDSAGWPPTGSKPVPLAFRFLRSSFGRYLLQRIETRPLTAQGLRMNVVDTRLITPAFVDRWVEVQRAPGHRAILMGMYPGPHSVATEAVLSTITAPTLVLHGEQDQIIEAAAGRRFADVIPGAKLITYPKTGHLPQYEIPDRSSADVAAFLKAQPTP